VLVSRLEASDQETDLTLPPNCAGLGRIRHFRRETAVGWPSNPLPIDPAARALGLRPSDLVMAQVFQNAACAWRCWYCYVPFNLLAGDERRSEWRTAEELVELWSGEPDRPRVIDLSGGSPDLTPEWVIWFMEALEARGLAGEAYLWSDDNLSTDYVFTRLTEADRDRLVAYRNYGRVCCFKGFDPEAFAFNTGADPAGWERQFELFARYVDLGLDVFGYVTLTGPNPAVVGNSVPRFVDRLSEIAPELPLRVVPLEIVPFTPMREREERRRAATGETGRTVQAAAITLWRAELERRFSPEQRARNISDVRLG
jgi:uncharacterized Fe-S cluster-containing radical SAM superfamily protein